MLVLSRRVGEQIVIGEDVVLTVVEVRNDTVRLGIDAPRSIAVNRAEVRRAVADANREATLVAESDLDFLRDVARPTGSADAPESTEADADAETPADPERPGA